MKKIVSLLLVMALLLSLAACGAPEETTSKESNSATGTPADSTAASQESTKPTESIPEETDPTDPAPTEPAPTQPKPTESIPVETEPTEPKPTEPAPTQPKPTQPVLNSSEGLSFLLNEDGVSYSVIGIGTCTDTDVVIPAEYQGLPVTSILYMSSDSILSVIIPEGVTSIGRNAFGFCESLTSVIIPSTVTSIGDHAFWFCKSLTSITIPDGVTRIGDSTFDTCNSLTSITIPSSVTSIGKYALSCSSLTSIHFGGTQAQWNAIVKTDYWNTFTGRYIIYCTDGEIEK